MNRRSSERGASKLAVLFWLLLLFVVVHVGLKLIPMYMDYYQMKDEITAKADGAQFLKDQDMLNELTNKAKELGLPLTADDFIIDRDTDAHKITVSTKNGWDVEVHFLFDVYVKTYHFAPMAEKNI